MSKWLKGKKEAFNKFKEEKKQEQEQQQAGPRRTDIIWPTPDKGTPEKPKIYEHRLLPDENDNFYKSFFYHMYQSTADNKWNFVFCEKSYGMENYCPFCSATMALYKGSKSDKKVAYNYKRKRKHCVNTYVVNDPRDADAETEEEKMTGKVKIYEFPDAVEAKIKSEMNDEAHGAGIHIFDPGEDGYDFILKVGATKAIQEEGPLQGKQFPEYSNSKFSNKPSDSIGGDDKIEQVMSNTHNLDEYLESMRRSEEDVITLVKQEMLWEYVKDDYPAETGNKDPEVDKKQDQEEDTKENPPEDSKENSTGEDVPDDFKEQSAEPKKEEKKETKKSKDDISDEDLLAELDDL